MDFPPILAIIFIWLLIGLPLSKLNQAAKKKQTLQSAKTAAANRTRQTQQQKPKTMFRPAAAPVREAHEGSDSRTGVLQPTITFTEHDDSVYQGSMNAETGEGCDPCHDEQMESLTLAEAVVPAAETEVPGLQLKWNGSEVVRGIVMSEILKRKTR